MQMITYSPIHFFSLHSCSLNCIISQAVVHVFSCTLSSLMVRKKYSHLCINLVFVFFALCFQYFMYFQSVLYQSLSWWKVRVMSSTAQSHSSQRRVWITQGLFWKALEGQILIRAQWGGPSSFFSASGCWYIFVKTCQSLLLSQHIKFSSKSSLCLEVVISSNKMVSAHPWLAKLVPSKLSYDLTEL